MTGRRFLAPAAAALLIAAAPGLAPAQDSTLMVRTLVELDDDNETAQWNGLSVDELEDMDIYTTDGEEIGEIEEVLANQDGEIVAFTAEVGGWLDIGDKEVIVDASRLEVGEDGLVTALTEEQMEALPSWDDD